MIRFYFRVSALFEELFDNKTCAGSDKTEHDNEVVSAGSFPVDMRRKENRKKDYRNTYREDYPAEYTLFHHEQHEYADDRGEKHHTA